MLAHAAVPAALALAAAVAITLTAGISANRLTRRLQNARTTSAHHQTAALVTTLIRPRSSTLHRPSAGTPAAGPGIVVVGPTGIFVIGRNARARALSLNGNGVCIDAKPVGPSTSIRLQAQANQLDRDITWLLGRRLPVRTIEVLPRARLAACPTAHGVTYCAVTHLESLLERSPTFIANDDLSAVRAFIDGIPLTSLTVADLTEPIKIGWNGAEGLADVYV